MSAPATGLIRVLDGGVALTPRMRRLRFEGDALADFPEDCEGAHIKLLFPLRDDAPPALPTLGAGGPQWPQDRPRPWSRTYTVAAIDPVRRRLDVDFVLHGDDGPASRWAARATPGQVLGLIGPGGPSLYRPDAERFLLIGDPSSLPLLRAVMRKLPDTAAGDVLIELPDPGERQPLPPRPRMRVHWLRRAELLDAVRALSPPDGAVSLTLAGESGQVVAIRRYLRDHWRLPKAMMYAVPYWKERLDEDGYHDERHRIMDGFDAEAA